MIRVGSTWNGDGAHRFTMDAAWEGILRATVYFWQKCQEALNVSNPRPYKNPAPNGQPPHKRTGFGAANVIYEVDQKTMTTRVGVLSNAKYMAIHEAKNHPWLMPTIKKFWAQLQVLATGGGK